MAAIHFNKESLEKALASNKVVVVDFFSTTCPPCSMLGPVIDKISDELKDKVVVGKVEVYENPDLADQYDIQSVPTIHFFVDGVLTNTMNGYRNKADIIAEIDKLLQ